MIGDRRHQALELRARRLAGKSGVLGGTGRAVEQAPGVHAQQAAGHPGQGQHAERQAEHVVPVEPAAIGRPPPISQPAKADHADKQACGRQKHADQRGPDDDPGPQGAVPAQHVRIEPVGNGPRPSPGAGGPVGDLHRLAGALGDIKLRTRRIAESEMAHRPAPAGAFHRPLIIGDEAEVLRRLSQAMARAERPRRRLNVLGRGRGHDLAAAQVEQVAALGRAQPQHGASAHHLKAKAVDGRVVGQGQRRRRGRQPQGAKAGLTAGLVQMRIAPVHHDEARQAPQHH